MDRKAWLAFACIPLFACTVSNPYDADTFVSASTNASVSETGTGSTGDEGTESGGEGEPSAGDGDGDPTAGDGDGDGDPATGDGDGEPTSGDGDGDGETDTDTDSGDGDGDPPAPCARYRYTYQVNIDSWDAVPLDQVWTGPNAPPCDVEPRAATYIQVWDQLLVWGSDGMYYRRVGGAWVLPEPIADHWGVVANVDFSAASNIPPTGVSTVADILFGEAGTAYNYGFYEDGSTVYEQSLPLSDAPLPAPNSGSETQTWVSTVARHNLLPNAEWLSSWQYFGDGRVYYLVGFSEWSSWVVGNDPLFANPPPGLDPDLLEAAWGESSPERVHLFGPGQ